ncbi:putative rRNA methyltransferase YlbH, partial [Ananas comosus]
FSAGIRERGSKKKILESYGLDPSDFIDEQSPRLSSNLFSISSNFMSEFLRRRKKGEEAGKEGKGRQKPVLTEAPNRLVPLIDCFRCLGKARRRKLLSPKGMDVRPMMEVVRGAAFDILQVASGCPASLRPGRWLDLYSGTGSVGIEAISRGCSEAHFVEMDPWVVSEVLRPNLEWTGFLDASVIHMNRVENFLEHVQQSRVKSRSFDYISVTPPYTAVDYSILMDQLAKSPLVGEDCFILVEYPLKTSMADTCGHLVKGACTDQFLKTNTVYMELLSCISS